MCAGATLVIVAIAWRARVRHRTRDLLRSALADPDPANKRAAIRMVGELGLARHGDVLLDMVRREQDPEALDALARAVVRNQWEPADQPTVFELRVWAHRRLECVSDPPALAAANPTPSPPAPATISPPPGPPTPAAARLPPSPSLSPTQPSSQPPPSPAKPSPQPPPSPAHPPIQVVRPSPVRVPGPATAFEAAGEVTRLRWASLVAVVVFWRVLAEKRHERTPWA